MNRRLGHVAGRGAAVTMGGQLLRILVQLTGIVVLARLLAPADYGVLAMVLAIIGVGEIFRDFGLSSAAIQARDVSRGQKSNLFWINTGIGLVLGIVVCALALPISAFYGDDRLVLVTLVLSSTFVFNGIATQFRADLNRKFRFLRLTLVEIAAQAIALGIAIGLALAGWGYWALVAQQVLQVLIQVVVLPFVTGWLPGLPDRRAPMGAFLRFGMGLVGVQLLTYASRNVDSIVIGQSFGASALGIYNRAFQLMLLPLNQVNAPSTRVALPTLSRLQDDPERYGRFLVFGQTVMMNVVSLVLAVCIGLAPAVIGISLGDQWAAAVPIFQVLGIAGFFQMAGYASYWIFLSKGLTNWNLLLALWARPLVVVLIILGGFWGVMGVAVAYTLGAAILWPLGLLWVRKKSGAPVGRMLLNGLRTMVVYGVATGATILATMPLPDDAYLLQLAVGLPVLAATLALIALVFPAYRRDLGEIVSARRFLRRAPADETAAEPAPVDEKVTP